MYSSKAYAAFVIAILVHSVHSWNYECPDYKDKCRCSTKLFKETNDAQCRDLDSNRLQAVIDKSYGHKFGMFQIVKSRLTYIDEELFSNISMNTLEIILCQIYTFRISEGLTLFNDLSNLYFEETTVKKWDFDSEIKKERLYTPTEFTLLGCPDRDGNYYQLVQSLPDYLTSITIDLCPLESNNYLILLKKFKSLKKLELIRNELSYFYRDYLPLPAEHLHHYSLSQNPIKYLKKDSFKDMPALKEIYLESTELVILPYDIFNPIMKQLVTLQVANNPLECDCANAWIFEHEDWKGDIPRCETPAYYKNKRITDINLNDLCPLTISTYFDTLIEYCNMTLPLRYN